MPERTTRAFVTFLQPFSLVDVDGLQLAGTYLVETVDQTLDDLSFVAHRRISTTITLPALGTATLRRQVITIDPKDLEAARNRDGLGELGGHHLAMQR